MWKQLPGSRAHPGGHRTHSILGFVVLARHLNKTTEKEYELG
jgi:hypothetical protein